MAVNAAVVMPELNTVPNHVGNCENKLLSMTGSRPMVRETAMISTDFSFMCTLVSVLIPDAAIIPNSAPVAPPSTGVGMAAMMAPSLGMRPRMMRMTPAPATT